MVLKEFKQEAHGSHYSHFQAINKLEQSLGYNTTMVKTLTSLEKLHSLSLESIFTILLLSQVCINLHLNKLDSPLPKDALCQIW